MVEEELHLWTLIQNLDLPNIKMCQNLNFHFLKMYQFPKNLMDTMSLNDQALLRNRSQSHRLLLLAARWFRIPLALTLR